MWKILSCSRLFGKIAKEPALFLRKKGFIFLENPLQGKTLTEEQIISLGTESNVLIVGTEKVSRKVIENLKDLKIVAVHGVGINNIDLEAATEKKVLITNAPGANTEAVADLAFMLMLGVARKAINAHQIVKNNNWGNVVGYELYSKTLGLIGFGNIGKAVARRAKGFDMEVLVYDPFITSEQAKLFSATLVSLEEIFSKADFVSLHAELNEKTYNLVGKAQLSLMKSSAILVNTARGGLIDTKSLIDCLQKKQIFGAGLDVFDPEPPDGTIFNELDNVLLGPHMGGFTFEALERVGNIVSKNIYEAYIGNIPPNLVKNK